MEAMQLRRRIASALAAALALATVAVVAGAGSAAGRGATAAPLAPHCTAGSQAPGQSRRRSGPLVPGKPAALLLCRYGPSPHATLEGSRSVRSAKLVHSLVRGLNGLPEMPSGAVACPRDDGSTMIVLAMYRKAASRVVQVNLSGCLDARRDGVVRWDVPDRGRFVHRLEQLTK